MSIPMTLKGGASGVRFFWQISIITLEQFDLESLNLEW